MTTAPPCRTACAAGRRARRSRRRTVQRASRRGTRSPRSGTGQAPDVPRHGERGGRHIHRWGHIAHAHMGPVSTPGHGMCTPTRASHVARPPAGPSTSRAASHGATPGPVLACSTPQVAPQQPFEQGPPPTAVGLPSAPCPWRPGTLARDPAHSPAATRPPTHPPTRASTHRREEEAHVVQRLLLRLVHAVRELREDAVHILHHDAKEDDLPAVLEHGPLRRGPGSAVRGGAGGAHGTQGGRGAGRVSGPPADGSWTPARQPPTGKAWWSRRCSEQQQPQQVPASGPPLPHPMCPPRR